MSSTRRALSLRRALRRDGNGCRLSRGRARYCAAREIRLKLSTGRYPFSRERKLPEFFLACGEPGAGRRRASGIRRPYQIEAARCETDSDLRVAPCAVQLVAEPPSSTWPLICLLEFHRSGDPRKFLRPLPLWIPR